MVEVVKKKKKTDKGVLYQRTCAYCGKMVSYYHAEKPQYCPYCGSYNYIKPETETKLFLLQKKYFEHGRDKDILGEMYKILQNYAQSMIKTELKRNEMTRYRYEDLEMKASDAATLLLEYYLTKPSFKIEQSFGGYLEYKVKEVLYRVKDQQEDEHESYNAVMYDNEGHQSELGDFSNKLNFQKIFGDEQEYLRRVISQYELLNGLNKILEKITNTVSKNFSSKDSITLLLGLYLRLETKRNISMDNFYRYFGSDYKYIIDKTLLLIYEFIKESESHDKDWQHE